MIESFDKPTSPFSIFCLRVTLVLYIKGNVKKNSSEMALKSEKEMLNGFLHHFHFGTHGKTIDGMTNDTMQSLLIEIFNSVMFGIFCINHFIYTLSKDIMIILRTQLRDFVRRDINHPVIEFEKEGLVKVILVWTWHWVLVIIIAMKHIVVGFFLKSFLIALTCESSYNHYGDNTALFHCSQGLGKCLTKSIFGHQASC